MDYGVNSQDKNMACYQIIDMKDGETRKFLHDLGFNQRPSCAVLSLWFTPVYPFRLYIPPDAIIRNTNDLVKFIYSYAHDIGISEGQQIARDNIRKKLDSLLYE